MDEDLLFVILFKTISFFFQRFIFGPEIYENCRKKTIPMSDEPYCRIVHTCKLFRILAHLSRRHNWAFLVEIFSLSVVFSSSLWLTFHIVILSEITRPIATKLVFKKPLEIDVQVCTNEGTTYFFIGGVLWFLIKREKLISA